MTEHDDLEQRLQEAYSREVPDDVASRHLAAIDNAVREQRLAQGSSHRWLWRHRIAAVASALTLAGVPAVAVAAEGAIPGDLLYPVKKLFEPVRGLVNDDVRAQHRLEELEVLLAEDAQSSDVVPLARDAAVEVARSSDQQLTDRFDGIAIEVERIHGPVAIRPAPTSEPTQEPTTDARPTPGATTDPAPVNSTQPDPGPTTDTTQPAREYRTFRVEDAGRVTVDITDPGVRLHAATATQGWRAKPDRTNEPRRVRVDFFHNDGRHLIAVAERGRDGVLHIDIRPTDAPPPESDSAPAGGSLDQQAGADSTTVRRLELKADSAT